MAIARLIIGLVGQICAGKSAVAAAFRKLGAMDFDADKYVHEVYRQPEVIEQVKTLFGPQVIDSTGNVNRKALGKIVFGDAEKLKVLTQQVIYPRTGKALEQKMKDFRESDAPALVLDAPTLFESGRAGQCDRILFVSAPMERRRKWAQARGWNDEELKRRQSQMIDENEKRSRADAIIDNNGTLEELDSQIRALLEKWRAA